jgi:hypothetical protein
MNSLQIENILKNNCHTQKYFRGVFSSNNIPFYDKYPYTLVANTDKKGTVGEHWVSIFVKNHRSVEYFDSLGDEPNSDISKYLSNFENIKLNRYKIQSPFSDTCGYYCIYFILNKSLHVKFKIIITTLLSTKNNNDALVKYLVHNLMVN